MSSRNGPARGEFSDESSEQNAEEVVTAAEQPGIAANESRPTPNVSKAAPLLMGVKLPIRVLMGRAELCLRDITQLGSGSVVELACSPNDPVEIMVNDRVIARGEIVIVAGNYGVRITQIAAREGLAQQGPDNDLLRLSERLK